MTDQTKVSKKAADALGTDDHEVIYEALDDAAEAARDALETAGNEVAETLIVTHSREWLTDQCMLSAVAGLQVALYATDSDVALPSILCDIGHQQRTEWPDNAYYDAYSRAALKAATLSIVRSLKDEGIIGE